MSVVRDPERGSHFGFALGDDDVTQAFIPRAICDKYQITEDDIGVGFRAMTRPPIKSGDHPQVMGSIIFDSDEEEGEEEGDADHDYEVDTLIAKIEALTELQPQLVKARIELDKVNAELAAINREVTEVRKWLAETYYPDESRT